MNNTHCDTQENEHSKLVVTLDGTIVKEFIIDKESISIGRKLNNDIHLSELTVSGNHSIIKTSDQETYIKDVSSTNGTLLNGVRISQSTLKHGDIIQIGNYQFAFHAIQDVYEPTMFIKAEIDFDQKLKEASISAKDLAKLPSAGVRVLSGPLVSTVLELTKPFNTLGFDGHKLAIIARNPDGYTISALSQNKFKDKFETPKVNGKALGKTFKKLKDHDIIELCDTKIEFFSLR